MWAGSAPRTGRIFALEYTDVPPPGCTPDIRQAEAQLDSGFVWNRYERIARALQHERFPDINPAGALAWLRIKSLWVDPAPLGRARSRDPKDDPVLATAVAVRADYLVAGDRDLLDLGKPFGGAKAIVT
jgi:hypothetical protein